MCQPKSMTLPARTPPPAFTQRCNSTYSEAGTHTVCMFADCFNYMLYMFLHAYFFYKVKLFTDQ